MALDNHATFSNTCSSLPSPLALEQHSEKHHHNLGKNSPGYYVIPSKTEGMRITQAAAGSHYFEDGLLCWSRKPAAVPIRAEVRDEAREAGQKRASGQDEGHVEQSVDCARSILPDLVAKPSRIRMLTKTCSGCRAFKADASVNRIVRGLRKYSRAHYCQGLDKRDTVVISVGGKYGSGFA